MNKTQIEITANSNDSEFVIGDKGIIDGYVVAKQGPYAVVINEEKSGLVRINNMKLLPEVVLTSDSEEKLVGGEVLPIIEA